MSDLQPDGWRRVTWGDIGESVGGGTPSTKVADYWGGGIPWVTPSDVTANASLVLDGSTRSITELGLATSSARLLPANTVLMTSRATIGEVAINSVPMATNQGFISILCEPSVASAEFVAFAAMHCRPEFEARSVGATFRELSKSSFRKTPLLLPPLPEQRAIARALKAVQAARDARRRELELERERKAALMEHLFTKGTRGEPTKMTEIGEMPESWEVVELESLVSIASGGTPSTTEAEWWTGGIPWATPKDMKEPRLVDTQDHLSEEGVRNGSRVVEAGAVLIVVRGMVLVRNVPVALTLRSMSLNQDMKALQAHGRVSPEFLLAALRRGETRLRALVSRSAHGTGRIGTAALRELLMPLPPMPEQREVSEAVALCDAREAALVREVRGLDELFRTLLEELMTGRLSAVPLIEE